MLVSVMPAVGQDRSVPAADTATDTVASARAPDAAAARSEGGIVIAAAASTQPEYADLRDALSQGRHDDALREARRLLRSGGDVFTRLYLQGLAQLAIARRTGAREDYLDAGLSFARVLVFAREDAPLAAPCLIELAACYQGIGRPGKALALLQTAADPDRGITLDPQAEPDYARRLNGLLARARDRAADAPSSRD